MIKKIKQNISAIFNQFTCLFKNLSFYDAIILCIILGFVVLNIFKEHIIHGYFSISMLAYVSASLFIISFIRQKKIIFPFAITVSFLLYLFWLTIATFYSKDTGASIWEILKMFSFFLLFISVYNLTKETKQVFSIFILFFIVFGSFIVTKDFYSFVKSGGAASGGYLTGSFYWHNQIAGFLLFLIPILLTALFTVQKWFIKITIITFTIISFSAFIFTFSRGGWISLFLALIPFVIFTIWKKITPVKTITFIVIAVFLLTSFLGKPAEILTKANSVAKELSTQTRSTSGNLRTAVLKNTLTMVKTYPLFGVGPGAFRSIFQAFQKEPWFYARDTHNHFLQVAAESGILGLFFFLGIFIFTMQALWKHRKKVLDIKNHPYLFGTTIALLASTLHAVIDFDWNYISLYSFFWIFLSMLLAQLAYKEKIIAIRGIKQLAYIFPFCLLIFTSILLKAERTYLNVLSSNNDNPQKAEQEMRKAIKLNPFNGTYHLILGQTLEKQKKYQQAKTEYNKAISLSPFNAEIYFDLGSVALANKQYKEAEKWFKKAIEVNPYTHSRQYIALAGLQSQLGDNKAAEKTLKTAIYKAFPLNDSYRSFEYLYKEVGFTTSLARAYFALITLDMHLGKKEEAKQLLNVVEKTLDPKNPLLPDIKKYVNE